MSRADDDYEDDDRPRPRRRPRDDDFDDDDDRPRRRGKAGGGGGGGGVLLIVLAVGGVALLCVGGLAIALILPAVQKVREAAARAQDMNHYKQVSLGLHGYADRNTRFPPADGPVSWRVHVLPYLEQQALYQQFDATQPWDGAKNRPLAETQVKTFVSTLDGEAFTQTRMRVFTGADTLFPPAEKKLRFPFDVTDGLSNTLLTVESADTVPWPQPRELAFTKGGPLPALGHPRRPTGFIVMMGDGSVRFAKKPVNENMVRAAITPAGDDGMPDF